jgi:hemerythrin
MNAPRSLLPPSDASADMAGSLNAPGEGAAAIDPATFTILEWDPELYGVGVRSIDEQHQGLIVTLARLCRLGRSLVAGPSSPQSSPRGAGFGSGDDATAKAGGGSGGAKSGMARAASSSATFAASGGTPMTIKGALMLDTMHRQDGNASRRGAGGGGSDSDEDSGSGGRSPPNAGSRKASTVAGSGGSHINNSSSNNNPTRHHQHAGVVVPHVHVYARRVGASECASRFVDRGLPPELQRGGAVEAHIEALVHHGVVRLVQEEHSLEAVSYVDRGAHALEHQVFVREVFRVHHLMEAANLELGDLVRLVLFLKAWLRDHIAKDRRYAPLMLEKQFVATTATAVSAVPVAATAGIGALSRA